MQTETVFEPIDRALEPPVRRGAPNAYNPRAHAPRPPQTRRTRAARAAARRKIRMRKRLRFALTVLLAVALVWALASRITASKRPEDTPKEDAAGAVNAVYAPQEGPPYVVAIDAGHGGTDVGAQGVVNESTLTEMTIGFLEEWLTRDENFTPVRTHDNDTFVDNTERAAAANRAGASLLLSVHANSDPTYASTTGFECYPQTPGRTHHDAARTFAHAIADGFAAAGHTLRGNAGVRYIYYVGDDAHGYEKQIIEESDDTVREEQSFGILEKTNCPAVLAEQCFVTSETDVANWGGEAGCRRAARIYYEAICAFFGAEPLPE